jgi:endonuclease/exonuclease/phosphatase family metal-dependent hydrolase
MEIKVMTYNIHHGKGKDGKLNLQRIADKVAASGADVFGLNEVDKVFSARSNHIDQISWLSAELNMQQSFGPSITLESKETSSVRQYGNALLSRHPIKFETNHMIQNRRWFVEGRALLETTIQNGDQLVKIYVTHLSLNPLLQRNQVNFIINKLQSEKLPIILMGDLNMKRGSQTWKKLTGQLTDVCYEAFLKPCSTFPSTKPKSQLDYIFISSNFHIDHVEVLKHDPKASDHLPIKATLSTKE